MSQHSSHEHNFHENTNHIASTLLSNFPSADEIETYTYNMQIPKKKNIYCFLLEKIVSEFRFKLSQPRGKKVDFCLSQRKTVT